MKQQSGWLACANVYLVGPLVGLQQLRVQRSFVLNWIQTKKAAVVEGMRLWGASNQTTETLQLTKTDRWKTKKVF